MQVKELNQSILDLPDWAQFLRRSSVMIAAVLLGSALIMAIAANWLSWPKVGRVALLQATITALVLFAWWRGQRKPKDWASAYSLSSISINLAAIAIGGLLALIGQSYQTGADPWQLFALWAVLLLPWLIAQRSLFIILLVLILTNVALYLYFEMPRFLGFGGFSSRFAHSGGIVVAVNVVALGLTHALRSFFDDPHLVTRRFSMLFLTSGVVWWQVRAWLDGADGATLQNLFLLAGMSAAVWFYLHKLRDIFSGALAYGAIYVLLSGLMIYETIDSFDSLLLLFFWTALIGAGVIYDLRRVWKQRPVTVSTSASASASAEEKEPWFLRLFFLGLQVMVTVFFLLTWFVTFGEPSELMQHLFILVALAGVIYFQRSKNRMATQDLPLFLLLSSVFIGALMSQLRADNTLLLAWFLLLSVVIYVFSTKAWLVRFISGGVATVLLLHLLFEPHEVIFGGWAYSLDVMVTGLLCATVGLAVWIREQPAKNALYSPLWWSWALLIIGLGRFLEPSYSMDWDMVDIQKSSVHLYFNYCAALLPPLALFSLLRSKNTLVFSLGCAVALGVLSWFLLLPAPLANLALSAWVWAYAQRDRVLFWCSVVLLSFALAVHYYSLQWLLIHKAMALGAGGAWLAFGAFLLQRVVIKDHASSDSVDALPMTKPSLLFSSFFWVGLGAVLLITIQDVARKENLLANGTPVVLALAPVDPRSLMQGDFMALNFSLSQEVERLVRKQEMAYNTRQSFLAYLQPDAAGVSTLAAIQNPTDGRVLFNDQQKGGWQSASDVDLTGLIALEVTRKKGRWLPNGVDAWFFPEGQAEHFEQALYGEFKVNEKGKALLYRMLDEKAQPVAAPAEILDN